MFGSPSGSRSQSRQERLGSVDSRGDSLEKKSDGGYLDKGSISRPKPAYLENGLLSVPKPGFVRDNQMTASDDAAPWLDKRTIGPPRPGRPRSAEPLGRLSGMGMGMGYLK